MSGSNQQVSTRRGVDRGSVAMQKLRVDQPVSAGWVSQERLINAISRLCTRAEGHTHFAGAIQVVGISIRVGTKTFSIVGGLGFEDGQCRECGQ